MKICRKYLTRVQNSVFEGYITEANLRKLKKEIYDKINPKQDSICIYKLESLRYISKEEIGSIKQIENII